MCLFFPFPASRFLPPTSSILPACSPARLLPFIFYLFSDPPAAGYPGPPLLLPFSQPFSTPAHLNDPGSLSCSPFQWQGLLKSPTETEVYSFPSSQKKKTHTARESFGDQLFLLWSSTGRELRLIEETQCGQLLEQSQAV